MMPQKSIIKKLHWKLEKKITYGGKKEPFRSHAFWKQKSALFCVVSVPILCKTELFQSCSGIISFDPTLFRAGQNSILSGVNYWKSNLIHTIFLPYQHNFRRKSFHSVFFNSGHLQSRSGEKKAGTPIWIFDPTFAENNFSIAGTLQNYVFAVLLISSRTRTKSIFCRFAPHFQHSVSEKTSADQRWKSA